MKVKKRWMKREEMRAKVAGWGKWDEWVGRVRVVGCRKEKGWKREKASNRAINKPIIRYGKEGREK